MAGWTWFVPVWGIFGTMMFGIAIAFSVAALSVIKDKRSTRIFVLIPVITSIILSVIMTIIVALGMTESIQDMTVAIIGSILSGAILRYMFRSNIKEYLQNKNSNALILPWFCSKCQC